MKLPESYRQSLKEPLGILLPDSDTTREQILQKIPKDSRVITVGDHTTEKMLRLGIVPSLQITDGLEKRRRRPHPELCPDACDSSVTVVDHTRTKDAAASTIVITVDNPPAEITAQSISAIRDAFLSDVPVRIHVRGEEDLLVIPVCVYAPENSTVLYGQPDRGLVITVITREIRNKTQRILDSMGRT